MTPYEKFKSTINLNANSIQIQNKKPNLNECLSYGSIVNYSRYALCFLCASVYTGTKTVDIFPSRLFRSNKHRYFAITKSLRINNNKSLALALADIVLNRPDTAVPYQPTVFSIINVGIQSSTLQRV